MPIKRTITQNLLAWKNRPNRLPLILRGARQVGKTEAVRHLGGEHYPSFVEINLEGQSELHACFEQFNPNRIIDLISAATGQRIIPGETLLFIDEIQTLPRAIEALRYFKEKMPELDVIAAGSLLEFALHAEDFSMPVGRVEFSYMHPLSFREYLGATGNNALLEAINATSVSDPLPEVLHQKSLEHVKTYMALGGMPAVVDTYLQTQSLQAAQLVQTNLLSTYRGDFAKYATQAHWPALNVILDKIPSLLSHTVKYSKIDPDMRSIQLKTAIQLLEQAGVVHCCYASSAHEIPLNASLNYKKYKLFFLDIGLITARAGLHAELLMQSDVLLAHRGALAEQFVAQALLTSESPHIDAKTYYWAREKLNAQAEVDFVVQTVQGQIIPIEVKSGPTGRLKSLKLFMQEKKSQYGIHISQQPLSQQGNILHLPLYMAHELSRFTGKL
jgi:uncharacterized protein